MGRLFSIIMPCYNAQDYVDRAIASVVEQTVDRDNYELIAINDASTDDTLQILKRWENKFPDTIKVITYDTNLRQGGARNIGIKQACGEYICFLDADDWMDKDALKSFEHTLHEKRYDIITARHIEEYGEEVSDNDDIALHDDNSIIGTFDESDIGKYIETDLGFVWCSVYNKKIITENSVWFPEHLAYEDIFWQRLIKFYIKKACIISKVTHHHYNHPRSTMNRKNASYHTDRLTSYEMLLEESSNRGLMGLYYKQIMDDTIETYYFNSYFMFFTIMDEIPDVYSRIRNYIYLFFPDWETLYDDSEIPMVLRYMLKLLKKARKATPQDLKPFKEAALEILNGENQK